MGRMIDVQCIPSVLKGLQKGTIPLSNIGWIKRVGVLEKKFTDASKTFLKYPKILSLKPFSTLLKNSEANFKGLYLFFPRNMLLKLSSILPDTFVLPDLYFFSMFPPLLEMADPRETIYATLSLDPCQHPCTIIPASSISAVNSLTPKDI